MQINQNQPLTVYVLRRSYHCFNGKEGTDVLGVFLSIEKAREKMRVDALIIKGRFFNDAQAECHEEDNSIRYNKYYAPSDTPDMSYAWEITGHEVVNGDRPHRTVPEFLATAVRVFKYSDIEEYCVQLLNGRADRWTTVYMTDSREAAEEIASSIADGLWLEKRKTISGYTEDISH